MKNLFIFIKTYSTLMLFLALQIISFVLLNNISKTHQSYFAGIINEAVGTIDKQVNSLTDYLSLNQENKRLRLQNAALLNALNTVKDSVQKSIISLTDSTGLKAISFNKFKYRPAAVVGNSFLSEFNYIQIEGGIQQGVKNGMAVIGSQGLVGIVIETSNKYAKVMSLLNKNSKISAMVLKNNNSGDIEWEGINPHFLTMKKLSKSSSVSIGDTIVTSYYSANYPPKIPIGTVAKINTEAGSSFYNLEITPLVDFFSLHHVFVIENLDYTEQKQLSN